MRIRGFQKSGTIFTSKRKNIKLRSRHASRFSAPLPQVRSLTRIHPGPAQTGAANMTFLA
jgi:hypothetical protein